MENELTEQELAVLSCLWSRSPLTIRELAKALRQPLRALYDTVSGLQEKGYINAIGLKKERVYNCIYVALLSKEEYLAGVDLASHWLTPQMRLTLETAIAKKNKKLK